MNYTNLLLAWPYWFVFGVPVFCAIKWGRFSKDWENSIWALYTVGLVLFVGLRHEVGTDWPNYQAFILAAENVPLNVGMTVSDPGYALLNWIGANVVGGIYFPNFICAILAIIPLVIFARRQAFSWVSLFVVFPWLVVVAQMGFTRQGAAIGMIIMLIMALERSQFGRAMVYLVIAALLHRTAVVFAALIFLVNLFSDDESKALKSVISFVWGVGIGAVLFGFDIVGKTNKYLLEPLKEASLSSSKASVQAEDVAVPSQDMPALSPDIPVLPEDIPVPPLDMSVLSQDASSLTVGDSDIVGGTAFQSAGAVLRIGVGFAAAVGYLLFFAFSRNRREIEPKNLIWVLISVAQILLFPLAFFASTLADRLALYLIPLQIHVAGAAAAALPPKARPYFNSAVLATYALMFFVWLTRSDFALDWLPYDNILTHIW